MKVLLFIAFAAIAVYVYSQEIDPDCPDFVEEGLYVPNRCNCSSYYVCSIVGKISMPCPPGLHFNKEKRVCDWPRKANCKIDAKCPKPTPKPKLDEDLSV